jgi:membrane peptidoglycan carboxypeptidase
VRTTPALVRLALATVISVVAGVALAGLAFPLVGGLGLLGKSAADQFEPQKPPDLVLPQATEILDKDGAVIARLFTENRVTISLSQVPVMAQKALVAIEDNRFYEHKALDVKGTLRALALNSSSGSVQQGGSTLTQQYVKNLLIETADTEAGQKAASERSVKRKLQEARYAVWVEQHLTKDQILQGYFNIAYYGNGVYGIGAAAHYYFNKSITKLTLGEGAMLAGMVQNPSRFDPLRNPKDSRTRRNVVLDRMLELGIITQAERDKSTKPGLGLKVNAVKSGCEAVGAKKAPFFCDYVRRYLESGPAGAALGKTKEERQQRLLSGGLKITTTLDPTIQLAAQQAVDTQVPRDDPTDHGLNAAAVSNVVEPGTGAIKAMAVDRLFGSNTKKGETKVNLAIGGSSGFQGGSTFKAFILAAALKDGIPTSQAFPSPNRYCPKAFPYPTPTGCGPRNAGDSESGYFDMVRATWYSVNTYFIQLEEKTGLDEGPAIAEALGVRAVSRSEFSGKPISHLASFVFGAADGYSPLAMAGAYATFAANGLFCAPHPITSITDSRGKQLAVKELKEAATCHQVLDPSIAHKITGLLRGVVDGPGGGRTGASASIGRPVAGKTGTTNGSNAAWFIGYTPQLCTAVWVGKPVPEDMVRVTINGNYYKQVYGGTVPAAIWKQTMQNALAGYPEQDFEGAPLIQSTVNRPSVPDVTGLTLAAANVKLTQAGFKVAVGAAVNGAPVPAGMVASTNPSAGSRVVGGITVTIFPSNGLPPAGTVPTGAPTVAPTQTKKPKPPKPTKNPPTTAPPSPQPTKS